MNFHENAVKEIYDKSPFAFCVVQVLKGESGEVEDLVVSYANQALADFMEKPVGDVIGMSFYERICLLAPERLAFYRKAAFDGEQAAATQYDTQTGKSMFVQCYQIAYGYCGCLITDVTEQSRRQQQMQASLETERTVVSCAQKLISSPNFEKSVSYVLKTILHYFQSARSYIFELDREKQIAVNSHEECADGVSSQMQNLRAVPFSAVNAWVRVFESGRYVHIQDVEALKDMPDRRVEYETLTMQGIHSLLAVPYSFGGKLQGFIGVDDPKLHIDEIGFLTNLTYFISVEMDKHRLGQRLQAEEEKFRIATENSDIAFWTYDYARRSIMRTDSTHVQHGLEMVVENVPASLIAHGYIRKDSREAFAEMYRRLESGAKTAGGDFWTMNPRTNQWWCQRINYTNVFDANGKPLRAYAVGWDVTAEIQQKMDRTKLDMALSGSNLYIWEFDIIGKRFIQQTKTAENFGVEQVSENMPESIIEKGLVHPDSVEAYKQLHAAVCRGEKSATADICFFNAEKTTNWMRCTYTTILSDGKPVSAIGCAVNIDVSKKMEQKFMQEYSFLESLQSDSLLTKVRINVTKEFLESYQAKGKASALWSGATYQQGMDNLCATALTEEEAEQIRCLTNRDRVLQAFREGDTQYGMDYRRKLNDGSVIWTKLLVKSYQNPENGDVMSFLYTYDINDEKIREGMLEAVSALEYDFILYIDLITNSMRTYVGREYNAMIPAASTDDYVGEMKKLCYAEIVPEDVDRAIHNMMPETIKEHLKKQTVFSAVYTGKDNCGQTVRKRIQYAYLNEEAQQIVMTRTDVTDVLEAQKQQQDTLEAALLAAEQANSAKSDFLSRMSHEIRTPMNAIIGMSTIAAQSIGNDKEVADCIGKIGISSRFLLSLINDILDMSRIESGKMLLKSEKIPFAEFLSGVNTICYTQARAKDVDYENIVDANVEDYYIGDAMKLQQVVINILSNAIKFTPHNGKVTFSVRQMKKDKNRAVLRFVVNDTGCGISEEFIPRIFDPFAQEHTGTTAMYGGTGLGLAICKNLVDMMDGHIDVRSIVGAGSEFTVDVTLGITEESRTRYLRRPQYNFSQLKALVVDDDVMVCEQAVITLKEIGVTSEWVDSGRKAVDRVRKKWDEKKHYDLILVDWKMPDMDGIETARQIRKIVGPDVTIIIMTAYDWAGIEHEAKLAGVNLLMSKPMFKSTLISAFQKAFGQQAEKETVVTADFKFDGKRVLLAEDHPLNVEVATRLLERKGFAVEHAENGLRALEMFSAAPAGYYDAILMDIRMPEMDGLQASYSIRRWRKEDAKTIPIIAMTANAFDDDIQKSKAAGMNAHLAKPIEPQQMYQTLYDFIYGKKD